VISFVSGDVYIAYVHRMLPFMSALHTDTERDIRIQSSRNFFNVAKITGVITESTEAQSIYE